MAQYDGAELPVSNADASLDVTVHNGSTRGLYLGGVLVTATATQLNTVAGLNGKNVAVTAATVAIDSTYSNKNILLNRAAGITVTLPAASGSGAVFSFLIQTTASGGSYVIKVANSSDTMTGYGEIGSTSNALSIFATVSGTSDTITLNGTTTGGIAGARVVVRDVATNLFQVEVYSAGTTAATPFSATV